MKLNFKLKLSRNKKPKDISHFSYHTINPVRDWHTILIVFLVLNVIGAGIGGFVYFTSEHHVADIVPGQSEATADLGQSRLHSTMLRYGQKETDYETAKISVYNVVDPSLP